MKPRAIRIVSGGQTGVDRAALDVAAELGIARGGWCPRDRRAEDGAIDDRYPLRETPSAAYRERTDWNVRDADATLILARGRLTGGTSFTRRCATRRGKPLRVADPSATDARTIGDLVAWLGAERVAVLNVAGPRESTVPGIGREATVFLRRLLAAWLPHGQDER